jgi:hemerythrin-like domain-containing protein
MIEHRLIERMIRLLDIQAKRIRGGGAPDPEFVSEALDFIRTYADRCHHGKEEDILFRDLGRKTLAPTDAAMMNDLNREHIWARSRVKELADAAVAWQSGSGEAVGRIAGAMEELSGFYPEHIRKEDKEFFPTSMNCFSAEEKDRMLAEMSEFDRKLIHEHYRAVVGRFEPPKVKEEARGQHQG